MEVTHTLQGMISPIFGLQLLLYTHPLPVPAPGVSGRLDDLDVLEASAP